MKSVAIDFTEALLRQVQEKSLPTDNLSNNANREPMVMLASIVNEVGEVSMDMACGRNYSAVVKCIDMAHSALLLALKLDPEGDVLRSLYTGPRQ